MRIKDRTAAETAFGALDMTRAALNEWLREKEGQFNSLGAGQKNRKKGEGKKEEIKEIKKAAKKIDTVISDLSWIDV